MQGSRKIFGAALFAALVGAAIARFVAFDGSAGDPPPSPAVGVTLADRITALEKTVAKRADSAGAWQQLGSAYVRRAGESGDPSFYGLAERALERADELVPDDPATIVGKGTLALARHDFAAALELGLAATRARPASPDALALLVDAHVELGRYEEAATTLQRLLDLRPGLPALSRASYLRELHGDLDGAVEAMQQAEAAGSGSPLDVATVAALLGDLHVKRGDLAGADAAYRRALAAAPGLVSAEVGRARVLWARGRIDRALGLLGRLVERAPHPSALVLLAELQRADGRSADAARTAQLVRATASLQEAAGQVVDLEMALFEADLAEDPARAVALARRAHDARPDNVYALDALAWALHRAGDPAAARPYAQQSLRLGSADPVLRRHAAAVFEASQ